MVHSVVMTWYSVALQPGSAAFTLWLHDFTNYRSISSDVMHSFTELKHSLSNIWSVG